MTRAMDLTLAFLLIFALVPFFMVIIISIYIFIGSPIFFRQIRPGLNGKPFEIIKFRTMKNAVDRDGAILPDYVRLTTFGKLLRSTSLDELPSLWNVLKGDMSLVGPRPLLMEYLPLYNDEQSRRHNVKPGVTGWAQVNGRNAIGWDEKFKLDVWYVENQSFALDIKILLLTVVKVFKASDISHDGHATMSKFQGMGE